MAQPLDRRSMLKAGAAMIAAPYLWLPARAAEPAWPTRTVGPYIEVEIDSGRIRGGHSRGALAFKGIPYAGSVSGRNRFKEAPKLTPWTGVRDATRLGPPAMQGPGTTYGEHEPAHSEDCLAIETAAFMGNNTALLADRKSLQPAPVYRYREDFRSSVPIEGTDWTLRACHASDIAIVFYNYEMTDLQGHGPGLPAVSRAMSAYFASFARSSVPSAPDQPAWPRYRTATREEMLLNSRCRVAKDPDGEERKLWRSLGWT